MSDVRTAKNLISVVDLVDVRLLELHTKNRLSTEEEIPRVTINYGHKAAAVAQAGGEGFLVRANIDVQINAIEEEDQPLVRIRAKFELRYKTPPEFAIVKKELNAFARVNAVYNAWPYFRELVQSVTGRMNLPHLILPVFRIPRPNTTGTPKQKSVKAPPTEAPQGSEVTSGATSQFDDS